MSWGIFPLFFTTFGLGVERIGILKAVYPTTWGILQLVTGPLSDRWGRKGLIVAGMWVQAAALFLTAATRDFLPWLVASLLLGIGTAMVYPSLIAAVSDASLPHGGHDHSASIAFGATSAMRLAHSPQVSLPIFLGLHRL